MKTKILITESQYDILLHSINEQNKSITIGGGKINIGKQSTDVKKFSQNGGGYEVTIPENEWDSYIQENEEKLFKAWGNKSGTSGKNWSEIKVKDKRFAIGILETFVKGDYTGLVISKKTESTPAPGKTDEPKKYPTIDFEFPAKVPANSQFFVDNEWILTSAFTQTLMSEITNSVQNVIKQALDVNPEAKDRINVYLNSLSISTSCSRLPNGPSSASTGSNNTVLTFEQLSQNRNNTVKNYVLNKLKDFNVGVDDNSKINQDWLGQNKDGTSGPNWDSKLPNNVKRNLRPNYEKYKYVYVKLSLQVNDSISPVGTGSTIPDKVITSTDYKVKLTKRHGFSFSIPKLTLKFGKNPGFKGVRSLDCEFFNKKNGGDSKSKFWNDPKLGYQ